MTTALQIILARWEDWRRERRIRKLLEKSRKCKDILVRMKFQRLYISECRARSKEQRIRMAEARWRRTTGI